MGRLSTVDEYIPGNELWQDCLLMLREILGSTPMEETMKRGGPVYTFRHKNVIGMAAFKS